MVDLTAILGIADDYSKELDSKFRSLSKLVKHSGEVGRAHEELLRVVLRRFLPGDIRIASGFVRGPVSTSPQQDILLFDSARYPSLFEVGECVVALPESLLGVIEVKTQLRTREEFRRTVTRPPPVALGSLQRPVFTGLFVWESLSLESTISLIDEVVSEDPSLFYRLPHIICAKGKHILVRSRIQLCQTYSYESVRIGSELEIPEGRGEWTITDGLSLLMLVSQIYQVGSLLGGPLSGVQPWWLGNWSFSKKRNQWTREAAQMMVPWFASLGDREQKVI